jgi:hypothetical protein
MAETFLILQPSGRIEYDGSLCGDCTFCCWGYGVRVPAADEKGKPSYITRLSPPATSCWWLGENGCQIHADPLYPVVCGSFVCPYVLVEDPRTRGLVELSNNRPWPAAWRLHRPGTLLQALQDIVPPGVSLMPAVPAAVPLEAAAALVRASHSLPAARKRDDKWLVGILRLPGAAPPEKCAARWNELILRFAPQ